MEGVEGPGAAREGSGAREDAREGGRKGRRRRERERKKGRCRSAGCDAYVKSREVRAVQYRATSEIEALVSLLQHHL